MPTVERVQELQRLDGWQAEQAEGSCMVPAALGRKIGKLLRVLLQSVHIGAPVNAPPQTFAILLDRTALMTPMFSLF